MAGTYSQVYIQVVFSVKYRKNQIGKEWKEELNKYISGIITAKGHKSIIVNGMADHIHCFIGLRPFMSVSDLVRDIKNNSSRYINEQNLTETTFRWQEGYGVFSYSHDDIQNVYNYIQNQERHHQKQTFKEEYESLLKEFDMEYKPEYLFDLVF